MRCTLAVLVASVLLPATTSTADAAWGTDPFGAHVPVCTAGGVQSDMQVVSDGAGGVIVAWVDERPGATTDIYAQRIGAAGVPLWTTNGVVVCNLSGAQDQPVMVSDGAGGAILAWSDRRSLVARDIWAQRINGSGTRLWGTNGVQVTGAGNDQDQPTIAEDGSGGALIAWRDKRGSTSTDVYAQRLSSAGTLLWTNGGITTLGVPVTVAAGFQYGKIISDGTGGAIVAWNDSAGGNYDIKAQRLNAANGLEAWTAGGVAITADASVQYFGDVLPDGSGGAIVVWPNYGGIHKEMAQRLDPSGNKLWFSNNLSISGDINDQGNRYEAVPDGAGGLFGADSFNGNRPTAARVTAFGLLPWGTGVVLGTAHGNAPALDIVRDGAGGCVIASVDEVGGLSAWRLNGSGANQWSSLGEPIQQTSYAGEFALVATTDAHFVLVWVSNSGVADIYAERFDLEGALGSPAPVISSVADVPNDQGGRVKVSWDRSSRDTDPDHAIVDYRLWRSVPTQALAAGALGARWGMTADPDEAAAGGRLLMRPFGAQDYAWELVGTQVAATLPSYSIVTNTESDSIGGSNPLTVFMVEARGGTSVGATHWFSAPDSGYSVDDLPPAQPAPFAAVYAPGTTALHWGANAEADFATYRLYRGADPNFPLDGLTFVAEGPDTAFVDPAARALYYKLVAVDIHGNVSPFALVRPADAVAVPGGGAPRELSLSHPSPHPMRAGSPASVRFALPAAGPVSVRLYDSQGRARATLANARMEPGEYTLRMEDATAALPAGIYFLRIEAGGRQRVRKLAVTD